MADVQFHHASLADVYMSSIKEYRIEEYDMYHQYFTRYSLFANKYYRAFISYLLINDEESKSKPNTVCSALRVYFNEAPRWLYVPCDTQLLDSWVCKRSTSVIDKLMHYRNQTRLTNIFLCRQGFYRIGNICYNLTVHNLSSQNSTCNKTYDNHLETKVENCSKYLDQIKEAEYEFSADPYQNTVCCSEKITIIDHCRQGQFQCHNQECISDFYVCDGYMDCSAGEDELHCSCQVTPAMDCLCQPMLNVVPPGKCVPFGNNLLTNVSENKMEDITGYKCSDGHITVKECSDDESYYGFGMNKAMGCSMLQMSCIPYSKCHDIGLLCQYDLDHNNQMIPCRNGFHLQKCEKYECTHSFKCYLSYCIPYRRVCDGVYDCIHGDDEDFCQENICDFILKCRTLSGTYSCIHSTEVCDGVRHCLHGEDELLCDVKPCQATCQCLGLAMHCSFMNMTHFPITSTTLKYLAIMDSNLTVGHLHLMYLPLIEELVLSENTIEAICNEVAGDSLFTGLPLLKRLDLSYNKMSTISKPCILHNSLLRYLNLSHNRIIFIGKWAFMGVVELEILDISFNKIKTFDTNVYAELHNLLFIDIRSNPTNEVLIHTAFSVHTLVTNTVDLCCAVNVSKCLMSDGDTPSCQQRLLPHNAHIYLGIIGIMTIVLNLGSVLYNTHSKKSVAASKPGQKSKANIQIYLSNCLNFTDCLCGLYLLLLVAADSKYTNSFTGWRNSFLCTSLSFISMAYLCMSPILSMISSLDRLFGITQNHIFTDHKYVLLAAGLACVIVFNSPVLASAMYNENNKICLIFLSKGFSLVSIASAILVLFAHIASAVILSVSYWKIYLNYKIVQQNLSSFGDQGHKKEHSENKLKLKRNLLKIVVPNCLAGMIIVIILVLSMIWEHRGDQYNVVLYSISCYAVINPIIYTFSSTTVRRDIILISGIMVTWWHKHKS